MRDIKIPNTRRVLPRFFVVYCAWDDTWEVRERIAGGYDLATALRTRAAARATAHRLNAEDEADRIVRADLCYLAADDS